MSLDRNLTTPMREIAAYAASSDSDAIPADVVERAKLIIIDELACASFGARSAAGDLVSRYVRLQGGTPESTVLGCGTRVPATLAALANGTAGHGEEVDGAHAVGGHPGATIVAAAFALAEKQRASGSELLNAVVLGYDIGVRILQACGGTFDIRDRLGLHSDFLYSLGAAAASARLLHLDEAGHRNSLALTTLQANGLYSLFHERRHLSKSLSNGQYAAAGVRAALMASVGLEGVDDVLCGEQGLLDAWGAVGGKDALTRGLGGDFMVMTANFKTINAGYPIHAPVEAALRIVLTRDISPGSISRVLIGLPENSRRVVDNRQMHNICVQDMVCAAIIQRGIGIRQLPFPTMLTHPEFHTLRNRIFVETDEELDRLDADGRGGRVTITHANGETFTQMVPAPCGHSSRGGPTWNDLEAKWRDGLPGLDIDQCLLLGRQLDQLDDMSTLARLLSDGARASRRCHTQIHPSDDADQHL